MSFDRLIRFLDDEGRTTYGNVEKPSAAKDIIGQEVLVLEGNFQDGFTKTTERRKVSKVRSKICETHR